jgi:ATP-binding cassette subfamily B protein
MRFVKSDCTDAEILEAMNLAECEYLALRTSQGLDTHLGESGLTLSGGERQRLAIARALIRKPWLLVLDEATSSLDVATEQKISQTIQQIVKHGNFITIIVSHRLPMLAFADSIIVMEKGEIENVVDQGQLYSMTEAYSRGTSPAR